MIFSENNFRCRPGRALPPGIEARIFHHRFARTDGIKEIGEMIEVFTIARRRREIDVLSGRLLPVIVGPFGYRQPAANPAWPSGK